MADLVEGVAFGGFSFDGAAKGALDDLSVTGDLALADLATDAVDVGKANLDADISLKGDVIDVTIDGGVDGLRVDRITPDLIGLARIGLSARMDGDEITLSSLALTSDPLVVSAKGGANLAEDRVNLTYDIAASDLGPFAAAYEVNAEGAIAARGAVSGPLSAPRLKGDAAFTELAFDDEALGKVDIAHNATFGEAPAGDLMLAADGSRFGPITFDGGFLLDGDQLTLSEMTATGLGAEIDGGIAIDLATTLAEGLITIDAPDLSQLSKVAQQDVAGGVTGRIRLSTADARQNADLDVDLTDLSASGVTVTSAGVEGAARDVLGDLLFDLSLTLEDVDAGVAQVASGRAKASGALADITFDADLTGVRAADVSVQSVTAKGAAKDALDTPQFDVTVDVKGVDAGAAQVATGRATAVGGLEDVKLTAALNSIRAGDATIARTDLIARVRDGLTDDPAIEATVTTQNIDADPAALESAKVTATGRLSALDVKLTGDGALASGEALSLNSAARISAAGPLKATVSSLSAKLDENELLLEAPLRIASKDLSLIHI